MNGCYLSILGCQCSSAKGNRTIDAIIVSLHTFTLTASQNEWATRRGTVALQMYAMLGKTSGARDEEMKEDGKRNIL